MGRHEIRFRRHMMTSRRMESHKNYYDVLKKHERQRQIKRILKLIALGSFFLMLVYLIFYLSENKNSLPLTYKSSNIYEFQIDANRGDTLISQSASEIIIPRQAFLDESGQLVTGQVTVVYQEYRNAFEIALFGYDMSIQDGSYLESAGMFNFQAYKGSEKLAVNPDNLIIVNYASRKHGNGFLNYYMGENGWIEQGEEQKKTRFKILGNYNEFPELSHIDELLWEFEEEPSNQILDSLFSHSFDWPHLVRDNGDLFDLCLDIARVPLAYGEDLAQDELSDVDMDIATVHECFKIKVVGKMNPSNFFDLYSESRSQRLKSIIDVFVKIDTVSPSNERLTQSEMVMNSFTLSRFGTWNSDRPFPINDYITLKPSFTDDQGNMLDIANVVAINEELNTVFRLKTEEFKVKEGSKYTIFHIDEERAIYHNTISMNLEIENIELKRTQLKSYNVKEIAEYLGFDVSEENENITSSNRAADQNDSETNVLKRPTIYNNRNIIWFDRVRTN